MIYRYDNGLRIVHRETPGMRSVAVCVMVGVGSANETPENNGISHFIEHMMFKGTDKRTSFDITRDIDALGAQINAFTSKQVTCYYTVSVDEYAENCMEIMSDFFFGSTFPEEEMEREKGVVLEEISMSDDDPSGVCLDNLSNIYFKGSSLGMNIIGERKNVKSFTRQQIKDYIAANYCTGNTVVAVVGNIEFNKAKDLAEKYFADKFTCSGEIQWQDKPHLTHSDSSVTIKDIEQANIGIVFPSIKRIDPLDYAQSVMNTIFGSGMSSRLFQNLREKQGLAYSVFSYPSSYCNNGNMAIYIGTNYDSVGKAVESVRNEIAAIKKNGLTDEELERGKRQLKGSIVLGQESTSALMRAYARHALFANEMYDFDDFIEQVNRVTHEDIKRIVDLVFDFDKVSTAYVGRKIDVDVLRVIKG